MRRHIFLRRQPTWAEWSRRAPTADNLLMQKLARQRVADVHHEDVTGIADAVRHEQQQEQQQPQSGRRGSEGDRAARRVLRSGASSRRDHKRETNLKRGAEIAEEARHMTDTQWENLAWPDKRSFVDFMSKRIREAPADVSEQQRRRYYEQTGGDPRNERPDATVTDPFQRLKLGLPVSIDSPSRQLGVTDAMYAQGDADLFDPDDASKIENAMKHVKQLFVDYVRKKKEGVSTEIERRRLANVSAELNRQTQRHLAHMFKRAEQRLKEAVEEEQRKTLAYIAAVRARVRRREAQRERSASAAQRRSERAAQALKKQQEEQQRQSSAENSAAADSADAPQPKPAKRSAKPKKRKNGAKATRSRTSLVSPRRAVEDTLRRDYGLDLRVAQALWSGMRAQERFLEKCEVMARLTLGRGFAHTPADEGLDAYSKTLQDIYSHDPRRLAELDAVQALAARDGLPAVDWAKRWFEQALLVPLQQTPEWREIARLQEEERQVVEEARRLEAEEEAGAPREDAARSATQPPATKPSPRVADDKAMPSVEGDADADAFPSFEAEPAAAAAATLSASASATPENGDASAAAPPSPPPPPPPPPRRAQQPWLPATQRIGQVVNLVEKMFLHPSDQRLKTIHEKRLRYLAYCSMEAQIARMRRNAKRYEGAENAPEAAEAKALYAELQRLKEEHAKTNNNGDGEVSSSSSLASPYSDPKVRAVFEKLDALANRFITSTTIDARVDRARRAVDALRQGRDAASRAARTLQRQRKREQVERMLRLMEKDVREDMLWLENLQEAERPPLLPIPEPMSYVSAADVAAWKDVRAAHETEKANPFAKKKVQGGAFQASFLGQPWQIPDRPMLFWGTGSSAVQQALAFAAEDAERQRRGEDLAPPYPCAENPWGWRLRRNVLDGDTSDVPSDRA